MTPPIPGLPARFWAKVDVTETCWLWTGCISPDGYGRFLKRSQFDSQLPHRAAWQVTHGAIPEGMELDHLCNVRNCVRPDHLEVVTHAENIARAVARRTECRNGHPRSDDTWVSDYCGGYRCLICRRAANAASNRRRRRRLKAEAA